LINFEVNLEPVKLRVDWSEITIDEAATLYKMAKEQLPKELIDFYALHYQPESEENEIEKQKLVSSMPQKVFDVTIPTFCGSCLEVLSDIKPEVLKTILGPWRATLYREYIAPVIMGLLNVPNYEHKGIKSFKFEGETYYLPESQEGYGVVVPMAKGEALEFCEVADIEANSKEMAGGRWELAPVILAIIARPKYKGKNKKSKPIREEYNQTVSLERAKNFKLLKMNVAMEVFFCFIQSLTISNSITRSYLIGPDESRGEMRVGLKDTVGAVP